MAKLPERILLHSVDYSLDTAKEDGAEQLGLPQTDGQQQSRKEDG